MGIDRDLHDLLFCHDCVIVPQWGGFLTHYRPARLDEARKVIHPPGKDLSFNRHLVRNDGLLADRLAKREGIGFDKASALIDSEVAAWRVALDRQGRLELPSIGIFYRDAEHNLQFDPDRRANYLRDAYGLRPLPAVPVQAARAQPVVLPLAEPEVEEARAPSRRGATVGWAAAGVAAVLIGAAAVWAFSQDRIGDGQWSGWAFLKEAPAPTYQVPSQAGFAPVELFTPITLPDGDSGVSEVVLDEETDVRIRVALGNTNAAPADTTHVVMKSVASEDRALRFHVVGGCFAQPENAEKLLAELRAKGFPARRLRQRGQLHPVAFGSHASREEAMAQLAAVREQQGRAAWLLVR
jgi:cell division septation protein DedD